MPEPIIPDVFSHFQFPDLRPPERDWAELPLDAISYILHKLDQVELLTGGVAAVCRSWHHAARHEPELWRRIVIRVPFSGDQDDLVRAAVCLSAGQCEEFNGEYLDDDFLLFLAHRAPLLKRLRLLFCSRISNQGFAAAMANFPLLEELELDHVYGIEDTGVFEHVARSCPRMKHVTYIRFSHSEFHATDPDNDREALAIASMPELRTLQLLRDKLTNTGLSSVIDNCPHLEYLDIRNCRNITIDDALRAKCARIKKNTLLPYFQEYRGKSKTPSAFIPCYIPSSVSPWRIAHEKYIGGDDSMSHKQPLDSFCSYLGPGSFDGSAQMLPLY
uniref:Uncharacterized protein n=1 Tax=Avena sativa TaxID=4498 RepID=A0ACD5WTJ9_AVESA